MDLKKYYYKFSEILIIILPLVLLIPNQFKQNIYLNPLFWIMVVIGLVLLPVCYKLIKKSYTQKTILLLGIYLISLGIVSLTSSYPLRSTGILTLNCSYFILFFASGELLQVQALKRKFLIILTGTVFMLIAISGYNFFSLNINTELEGVSFMWIYFGHNHLAALLLLTIPFMIYLTHTAKNKSIRIGSAILLVINLFGLVIAFSRGALLALLCAFIVALVSIPYKYYGKFKILMLVLGILSIILCSLVLIGYIKSFSGIHARIANFDKGISMFAEKPIYGFGPGSFSEVKVGINLDKTSSFHPHNIIIQGLAEGGIILFVPMMILYPVLMINLRRKIINISDQNTRLFYFLLWIGILALLINEMTDFDLQLPSLGGLFWVLAGLIYFLPQSQE